MRAVRQDLSPQQRRERFAVAPEKKERHCGYNQRYHQPRRIHADVVDNDIENNRAKERKAKRHEAADEQQRAAYYLEGGDHVQIARRVHRADEFLRVPAHLRHRDEVEKRVEPKDNENEPKKDSGNDSDDIHSGDGGLTRVRFKAEKSKGAEHSAVRRLFAPCGRPTFVTKAVAEARGLTQK